MLRTIAKAALTVLAASAFAQSPQDFVRQSVEGLKAQTSAHSATWRLGQEANWGVDQDKGEITFSFADGVVARAPVQIIGTLNTHNNTFLWGWDHPSVLPPLRMHAARTKDWGKNNNIAKFTTRLVPATEQEAWEFTAVAVRVNEANGAYRARSGTALVFMTFGEIQLSKP